MALFPGAKKPPLPPSTKSPVASGRRAFGAQIREAREARGLSQEQLASALGVAAPYISQIESGRRIPSDELCVGMARALPGVLDWDALRREAHGLRAPETISLFLDKSDPTPELTRDQLFQELRIALADNRLPVTRREHLIRGWIEEIANVKGRLAGASVHRTGRRPSATDRKVAAIKGSR